MRTSCTVAAISDVELDTTAVQIENLRFFAGADALDVVDGYVLEALGQGRGHQACKYFVCMVSQLQVEHNESPASTRKRVLEPYSVVSVSLGVEMGRVYMRPERIGDKVAEWFKKREVDFDEHALFSSKYYVLASDEVKLRKEATRCFLDAIARYDELVIEIVGSTFYAMLPRKVNEADSRVLAELSFDVYGSILDGDSKWAK